jgi:rhodanese-related sulfurtransferase
MMKHLDACLVVLATLHSAAAAVPSADQLLDRFAVNADLYQRSFVTHVETNRVTVSQNRALGQDKPEKRRERTQVVFWWDGQRMREQRYTWGDFATGTIDRTHADYESHLFEVDRSVSYLRSGGASQEASVTYYAGSTPKGTVLDRVLSGAGSWSWGYFLDGAGSRADRVDRFLRSCQNARVRPEIESIEGASCYVLEAETPKGRYTLWMDPNHGYNFAKLHFEGHGVGMMGVNRAIKRFGAAWVPVKAEWEVRAVHPPDFTMSYRHEIVIEDLEIDPNYTTRKAFVMDDVPEGTKTTFLGAGGRPMPGEFVWRDDKPLPCVDEEALAQLERIAGDLTGDQAERPGDDVVPPDSHFKWGEERLAFLLQEQQAKERQEDTHDPSPQVGAAPAEASAQKSSIAAVKRKQAPHCGLYCLYLVMRTQGHHPDFGDLIRPEYLDTSNGSTLTALKLAAEDAGLHAEILRKASTRVLRAYASPIILHVKGNELSRDYDHYVLFLAAQGQQAQVYDPPGPVKLVSFDELVSRWDGKGLVVSSESIQLAGLFHRERMRLLWIASAGVVLLFLVSGVRRHIPWPEALSSVFGRAGLSGVQAGALAAVSLLIGLVCHSVSEAGFLTYPDGVVSTQRAHASDFIPRIDLKTAKRLQEEGAIFIDARLKRDFDGGHVEGAINIPVDTNDAVRRQAIQGVSPGDSLVVYCQSINCSFADIVAGKLRLDGFSTVAILPGGWMEWTTGVRPHTPKPNKNSKPGKWRLNKDGTASPI